MPHYAPKPVKHGTVYAYVGRKCRCAACRTAWKEYNVRLEQRRSSGETLDKRNSVKSEKSIAFGRNRMPWPDSYFDFDLIAIEQRHR